jgi:hypothetical protein
MTTLDGKCGFPAQRITSYARVGVRKLAPKHPAANVPPSSGLTGAMALIGFGSIAPAFLPRAYPGRTTQIY